MKIQMFLGQDKLDSLLSARENIEDAGSVTSKSFDKWATACKREIKKIIDSSGGKLLSMHAGHYYWDGFFQTKSGQTYNFFCSDVRHFPDNDICYRTVKSEKDYTGGGNQWAKPDMFSQVIGQLCCPE